VGVHYNFSVGNVTKQASCRKSSQNNERTITNQQQNKTTTTKEQQQKTNQKSKTYRVVVVQAINSYIIDF
jgi:hypothetical protein